MCVFDSRWLCMKEITIKIKVDNTFNADSMYCGRECPFYAVDFYSDDWECIFKGKCPVKENAVNVERI